MTDKEFDFGIELILKNDKSGLRSIYEEYFSYIYRTFINIVKSPQDAEDLTSDFFIKLWEKAGMYRQGSGHKRYLVTIAHNMAIDFLKKRNRTMFTLDDDTSEFKNKIPDESEASRLDETVESDISFDDKMNLLSDSEREIVNLHIGLELTFKEISEILRKPLGSVTWKYSQAIKKLRKFASEEAVK